MTASIGQHLVQLYNSEDRRKFQRLYELISDFNRKEHTRSALGILYHSTTRPQIRFQSVGNLRPERIRIARDTGDVDISDKSDLEISEIIAAWLGGSLGPR